ncbi:heme oxygenase [Micractinium conductrix]|uniref:heme oxygenase (biliverdin-producing) n=1 Tax=Micractinium conductrix TaxID=554055 RepID=A0A2P6VLI9_9CHLO|nr:heme oxygenase [Micractinium conductrix]|eukprot:PSC74963.1 heme oxygenase [Micractinium conductrix]
MAARPVAGRSPVAAARRSARPAPLVARRPLRLAVRASAAETKYATFLEELRDYSMKLHTKSQAPKEGQAPEKREQKPFEPTREGFLQFMVESKVVYEAFEEIMAAAPVPYYKQLSGTGLERAAPLAADIQHMQQQWGMEVPVAAADGPGHTYAALLRDLAVSSPPAFLCHYYNHYFAHTAGGRMIGKSVSNSVLDGWMGGFYQWDGEVKELLDGARATINTIAADWTREEQVACLEETPKTFGWGGPRVCSAVSAGAWGGGGGGGGGDSAGASAFLDGQGRSNGVGPLHLHSDHLLSAHAGSEPVAGVPGGTADGNDTHMPTSLFTTFPRLPPDGSTITPEEARCNPDEERCRTPIHVWETRCSGCYGSGTARSDGGGSGGHRARGHVTARHRLVTVCLLCHGLGYVRHSSTHIDTVPYVNGSGPHTTIGRPPPPERKLHHWPLTGLQQKWQQRQQQRHGQQP